MSQTERDWLDDLKRARDGKMTQREAAERMGVSDPWVRKLLKRMKRDGDRVVVHGLRGRASNRKLPEETRRQALAILKQPEWHDFGPTFASEQLAKLHKIEVANGILWKFNPSNFSGSLTQLTSSSADLVAVDATGNVFFSAGTQINELGAATPEPGAWLLMLTGVGAVGLSRSKRKNRA